MLGSRQGRQFDEQRGADGAVRRRAPRPGLQQWKRASGRPWRPSHCASARTAACVSCARRRIAAARGLCLSPQPRPARHHDGACREKRDFGRVPVSVH